MPKSPLDIMNMMGAAAHDKMQPKPAAEGEDDATGVLHQGDPAKKKKQLAAMKAKQKGKAAMPTMPKQPPNNGSMPQD